MIKETFDFYDRTSLKSYNLDKTMQYQLNIHYLWEHIT